MLDIFSAIDVAPSLLVIGVILAVVGLLSLLLVAWFAIEMWLEGRRPREQFDFVPGPHDGAAVPDFVNEGSLRNLAAHHKLEVVPSQVQETQGGKVKGGAPQGVLAGELSHQTTVTVEPHDDLGELVRKVVRHLHEMGELNQSIDLIWIEDLVMEAIPDFAEPDSARQAFQVWLEENYADGLDGVTPAQLAERLARLGEQLPKKKICERLKDSFATVANQDPEPVLFLEGEFVVCSNTEGTITLSKTNLRVESPSKGGAQVRSIPMPDGASITMKLQAAELTGHGKTRMVGLSRPFRARALATPIHYDQQTGCFELAPIAVYQAVGNK